MNKHTWFTVTGFASLCCLWFAFTLTTSSDMNQDLGRHIKIGEIIVHSLRVPSTNVFSYTNPDYPFINHHWLSEIMLYLLHMLGGVTLLIVLKSMAIITSLAFAWWSISKRVSPAAALAASALVSPFLLERSDIRPEIVGYIAFSLMLWILYTMKKQDRRIWLAPIVLLVWVNAHITFIFGIALAGLIAVRMLRQGVHRNTLIIWILAGVGALAVNPHGIGGVIYPFLIYREYGYTIVENQNMFFLAQVIHDPVIVYVAFVSPVIVAAAGLLAYHKRFMEAFILCLFSALAVWQIRHLPFAMIAAIMPLGVAFGIVGSIPLVRRWRAYASGVLILGIIAGAMTGFMNVYQHRFDRINIFGTNVREDYRHAADYMLAQHLPGPIFNNFDVGGYAIYRLYPTYRVFVDNRPEAYPSSFFTNTYIPMQEDATKQAEVFSRYGIRTIFFAHTDQTPWAQSFVERMLKDQHWRMVYLDSAMFIMTTDTSRHDIRDDHAYLNSLVDSETDYLDLLQLANMLSGIDGNLAMKAFGKASLINPSSCNIVRNVYQQRLTNPVLGSAEQLKKDNWICF